jgi:hypothetical protein
MRQPSGTALALTVIAALGLVGGVAALLLWWQNEPRWWEGYKAAMVIGGITAFVSLVPLVVGMQFKLMVLVGAYFLSFLLRTLVCLIAGMVAITVMGYPSLPTFALVAVFYLTLLGAEAAYLGVAFWSAKA